MSNAYSTGKRKWTVRRAKVSVVYRPLYLASCTVFRLNEYSWFVPVDSGGSAVCIRVVAHEAVIRLDTGNIASTHACLHLVLFKRRDLSKDTTRAKIFDCIFGVDATVDHADEVVCSWKHEV